MYTNYSICGNSTATLTALFLWELSHYTESSLCVCGAFSSSFQSPMSGIILTVGLANLDNLKLIPLGPQWHSLLERATFCWQMWELSCMICEWQVTDCHVKGCGSSPYSCGLPTIVINILPNLHDRFAYTIECFMQQSGIFKLNYVAVSALGKMRTSQLWGYQ